MMLSLPAKFEVFGAVRIYDVSRVLSLDGRPKSRPTNLVYVDRGELEDAAFRTVIVVPVKDEDLLTLENVLRSIPTESPVVVVSASTREPVDRFSNEVELARLISRSLQRDIAIVYQFDPAWSEALSGTPLESMVGASGRVRKGKGEGMLLGFIVAAALGADFVGYVDSDNYVPGSALEYSWIYYSALSRATSSYSMVRIVWPYKGKLAASDMYLRKRGRVSTITNGVLNYTLSIYKRIETDIIKTGNSGEQALTVKLGMEMNWGSGFAVETYQLVWMLENCYLGLQAGKCPIAPDYIEVRQVSPLNPHIHAERGDEHIAEMTAVSLGTIFHSSLASEEVKSRILDQLKSLGLAEEPPKPSTYRPAGTDPKKVFASFIAESSDSYYFAV
ncbi:mannosyl-3-phosphoglycerate synthase [Aeropyrum pernix K1]|uniref:Mannosyl-3-phosphoglycerate synthase n=2 Tax=Aeropyrum pernix TaxID=56636 RepID=MPGS_AERPE|nr:RecName: Full=Mannosyl-3-phosphoglycerate synthase; Short=MPG synthase; Short=MPGS [Aeropyrum pernix K1]BAA79872.2 mannosyl-3-phosphoglycerate synthase [Aeropyrum pernix K1]